MGYRIFFVASILLTLSVVEPIGRKHIVVEETMKIDRSRACVDVHKKCKDADLWNLQENDQHTLSKLLNDFRDNIASGQFDLPAAENMQELIYSVQQEEIAKCILFLCQARHVNVEDQFATRMSYNYFEVIDSKLPFNEVFGAAVKSWIEELIFLTEKDIESYTRNELNRNLVMIIWATSRKVGCSVMRLLDEHKSILICAFSPSGALEGKPIYKKGKVATKCRNGVSRSYRHLCHTVLDDVQLVDKRSHGGFKLQISRTIYLLIFLYCLH